MYTFFQKKQLLNADQPGFCPLDSFINQFLSISHKIFYSFDATPSAEATPVLSDISKTFNKV